MFFKFNPETKSFELTFDEKAWIESLIITQIFTDKKAAGDSVTGWWAEELEEMTAGSELYKLKRNKLTQENIELAIQSMNETLSQLEEKQILSDFQISSKTAAGALLFEIGVSFNGQQEKYGFQIEDH